jgi:FMN reductase [NAD(P)H]
MNQTIKQLQNRRSIRQFTGEHVSDEDLQTILKTAQRAPSSVNGQQVSLVYTHDKEKIAKIAKLCGGQPQVEHADVFVAIVMDFHRTSSALESVGKKHVIQESIEGVLVGAVDAGIMLNHLQSAAEALGYGTTAIGAVRANPKEIIELFNLPPKTFVVVGSTIGVPTKEAKEAPLKPRVPFESFAMEDVYDAKKVTQGALKYDKILKSFREENNTSMLPSYIDSLERFYTNVYFRQNKKVLEEQGFAFEDKVE